MGGSYIIKVGLNKETPIITYHYSPIRLVTATLRIFGIEDQPAELSSNGLVQSDVYFGYQAPKGSYITAPLLQTPDLALENTLRKLIIEALKDSLKAGKILEVMLKTKFSANNLHVGCFNVDDIKAKIIEHLAEYFERGLWEGGDAAYLYQRRQNGFSLFLGNNQRENLRDAKVVKVQGKFKPANSLDELLIRLK